MTSPQKEKQQPTPVSWKNKAGDALASLPPHEWTLLVRIAEANGQRVPISELSKTMGLPSAPALDRDFAGLKSFIAREREDDRLLTMPVLSEGSDEKGWYWMSAEDGYHFQNALSTPAD
jgi:hypothetical protein